jgi:hypothetical protein
MPGLTAPPAAYGHDHHIHYNAAALLTIHFSFFPSSDTIM